TLFIGLFVFLRLSPLGIQMRAAGEKALLAAQRGINFQLLFALSWALAGFAGALAGILYANNVRLDPSLGVLGLKAFAVALVGGLDSLGGVIPGALLVAAVEVLSVRYGDPLLADVSPFLCLLAMLLVRPWGLFGTKEELERVGGDWPPVCCSLPCSSRTPTRWRSRCPECTASASSAPAARPNRPLCSESPSSAACATSAGP